MTTENGWENLVINEEEEQDDNQYRYRIVRGDGSFDYKLTVWDPNGRMLEGPFYSAYGDTIIGLKMKARKLVRQDKKRIKRNNLPNTVKEGYLR